MSTGLELSAKVTPDTGNIFALKESVADLEAKLLEKHPLIPALLRTIHTQLRQDPELVTTLSEEEIGVIVNGLKVQTNTEIGVTASKSAKTALTKKIKSGGNLLDLI